MSIVTSVAAADAAAPGTAAAPADFDAEKAKCESQLADWLHCESASTPAGKAKIEQLSARLSAINAQVEKAAQAKADAARRQPAPGNEPKPAAPNSVSPLGHVVDAFA